MTATKEKAPVAANDKGPEEKTSTGTLAPAGAASKTAPMSMWCPPALRRLEGWVLWRYEAGDGPKPRKVPYYADGGRRHGVQGRREDRMRMVTFDAALSAAARRGFDGIGLCLLPEFGVVCVDFDNVVGPRGLRPDVAELVSGTFAEFSPGGHGIHAYYLGNLGNQKAHGEPFGLETFSSSGFVTFTGNALPHVADLDLVGTVDLVPVSPGVQALCAARFGNRAARDEGEDDDPLMNYSPRLDLTGAQVAEALEVLDPDMGHDDWLHVGMALHHELGDTGFELWDQWSSGGSKYPGSDALQKRWDSFKQHRGRLVTAATLVKMANGAGARIRVGAAALTAADLESQTSPAPLRFQPLTVGQLRKRPAPTWTIKKVLPETGIGMVYGPSMSGKSFFALDMCAAVARGVPWREKPVQRGGVAYVAAEGSGGIPHRLRAYEEFHGADLDTPAFQVIMAAPNLLERGDTRDLTAALRTVPGLRLIVVDTLAQTTPGANENSSEDMGRALAHCKALGESTGALVLLVGHTGKDEGKGVRGWSGQIAAFDVAIQVERSGPSRQATVRKIKDGVEGEEFPFKLTNVCLGKDNDGDDITSCVVTLPSKDEARPLASEPRGKWPPVVMRIIRTLVDLNGETTEAEVMAGAAGHVLPDGTVQRRNETVRRALVTLEKDGLIRQVGAQITLR